MQFENINLISSHNDCRTSRMVSLELVSGPTAPSFGSQKLAGHYVNFPIERKIKVLTLIHMKPKWKRWSSAS